jgi:hypothetical protein
MLQGLISTKRGYFQTIDFKFMVDPNEQLWL